jgi:hypothetical protein
MDLSTLVTACALTADPKIMHALIWHQSAGEPWSFTVAEERQPQVYRTARDAIRAAHATYPSDTSIRVGLTGLSTAPRSVTVTMFAPCQNITVAARQIEQLADRCKTSPHFKSDPIYCAIAVYHGTWKRPDNAFADAVRRSVANNDAPDFEMPAQAGIDGADIGSARQPPFHDIAAAPPPASDDRERASSSALFPAKSQPFETSSSDISTSGQSAVDVPKSDAPSTRPILTPPHANDLFVPKSTQQKSPRSE